MKKLLIILFILGIFNAYIGFKCYQARPKQDEITAFKARNISRSALGGRNAHLIQIRLIDETIAWGSELE